VLHGAAALCTNSTVAHSLVPSRKALMGRLASSLSIPALKSPCSTSMPRPYRLEWGDGVGWGYMAAQSNLIESPPVSGVGECCHFWKVRWIVEEECEDAAQAHTS